MDDLEVAIRIGAVAALRRRAERQRQRARAWTIIGSDGAPVRSGEASIAKRIADALLAAAAEIEEEARHV